MQSTYQNILLELLLSKDVTHVTLGNSLLHLKVIETRRVPTLATDGEVLLVNVQFFDSLKNWEKKAVLLHEVMHVVLGHPDQFTESGLVDQKVANLSMDDEVNSLIGFENLPSDCCDPHQIGMERGLTWLDYYPERYVKYNKPDDEEKPDEDEDDEDDEDENNEQLDEQSDTESSNSSEDDAEDQSEEQSEGSESNSAPSETDGDGNSSGKEGEEGPLPSGVSSRGSLARELGLPEPANDEWTATDAVQEEFNDIKCWPDLTIREKHIDRTKRGTELSDERSYVILNECDDLQLSESDRWQDAVIEMLRSGGQRVTDYSRRSRRCRSVNEYQPGRKRQGTTAIALVVDVSGSCVDYFPIWNALMTELIEDVPQISRMEILYHDTRLTKHDTWSTFDGDLDFKTYYGGGTCHKNVLEYAGTLDIDSIIQFTDCETDWPDKDPDVPVLTLIPPHYYTDYGCPFGKNIKVTL